MPGLCLILFHELCSVYYVLFVPCLLRPFGPVASHVPASAASGDVDSTADIAVITPLPFLTTMSCRGR